MAWQKAIGDNLSMARTKRPDAFSSVQKRVGERIAWARSLVEPNQAEFARLLGVDQSTLNKVEKGDRAASIFMIIAIANRLRVSTDFLLRGLLVGRTDEEMALRLGAEHPDLVGQQNGTVPRMGTDEAFDRLDEPTTPGPSASLN